MASVGWKTGKVFLESRNLAAWASLGRCDGKDITPMDAVRHPQANALLYSASVCTPAIFITQGWVLGSP